MDNISQVGANTILGKILRYRGQLSCETPAQRLKRLAIPLSSTASVVEGQLRFIYSTLEVNGDIIEQLTKSIGESSVNDNQNLASSILDSVKTQPIRQTESKISYTQNKPINQTSINQNQNQNNQGAVFSIPGYKSSKVIQPSTDTVGTGYNNKAHTNIPKEDKIMPQVNGTIADDVLKQALAEASNNGVSVQGVVAAGVAPTAKKAKLTAKKAKENQANWASAERSVAEAFGRFDIDAAKKFADDNKVEAILCTKKKNSEFIVGFNGNYDDKHVAKLQGKFFYNDQLNGATLADIQTKYRDKLAKVKKTLGWHSNSEKADNIDYSGVKGQDLMLCEQHKNAADLIAKLEEVANNPSAATAMAVIKDNSAPSMNAAKIKGKYLSKKEIKELLMTNSGFNIPFDGGIKAEVRLAKVTPKAGVNTSDIASYIEPKLVRAKDASGNRTDISSVTVFAFKPDKNKTGLRNFPIDGIKSVKYLSAISSGDGLTAGKVKTVRLTVPLQVYKADVDKNIVSAEDVIRLGINPEGLKSGASAELTTDKNRKSLLKGLVERIAVTTIDTGATLTSNGSADKVLKYLSEAEAQEKADREAAIRQAVGGQGSAPSQPAAEAPKAQV